MRVCCNSRGVWVQDLTTRTESTPAAEVVDWEMVVESAMGLWVEATVAVARVVRAEAWD